jgi:hypothetical protein
MEAEANPEPTPVERSCRVQACKIHAAENGYLCPAHWRLLSLENRRRLLAFPVRMGRPEPGRNEAIHAALYELRLLANPGVRSPSP